MSDGGDGTGDQPEAAGRFARLSGGAVAVVCTLGLILVITVICVLPGDVRLHDLATDLRARGASGHVIDAGPDDHVVFTTADGRRVDAQIATSGELPVLEAGTPVVYLPSDPTTVMTASDLDYYLHDAVLGGVSTLILGATPCLLTAGAWALTRRHPWWDNVARLLPDPL
ncbi:hypothetical protein AB6N23_09315 [Cellulomonas sp. 179-A 9B4 NHS]|uniref:hypothetical protein n=1 Tax=Cellulomonas sp. 179-A 9B4 NHS TaxID=3142379 RepID=UPI0039A1997C